MGVHYRKSKKIAPGTKLNIGKKSVGMSFGNKGGGISFNSKSGVRVRASIPGTGISFSSKIGRSKKNHGCLLSALMIPFYVTYFVCIWPFVALYRLIKKNGVSNKNHTSTVEPYDDFSRQLQIFDESIKLFMETKNPETFFGRYKDAERAANAMSAITNEPMVHGEPPQAAVEMLARQKTEVTNMFLDRYAKEIRTKAFELTRGRRKKIETFKLITSEYEKEMMIDSIVYRDKLYSEMLEKIEDAESGK